MARVSIFLIIVALVVGMAGCVGDGDGGVTYTLTLTIASTAGGSVTTPEEGTFTYDEGEEVNLVAEAEECYRFIEWTGDVDTIGNVNVAITTITMDDNYSITANFVAVAVYNLIISSTAGGNVTTPEKRGLITITEEQKETKTAPHLQIGRYNNTSYVTRDFRTSEGRFEDRASLSAFLKGLKEIAGIINLAGNEAKKRKGRRHRKNTSS